MPRCLGFSGYNVCGFLPKPQTAKFNALQAFPAIQYIDLYMHAYVFACVCVCVCVYVCIDLLGQSTYVTVTGILLMHSELPRGSVGNCIYAMHLRNWAPGMCAWTMFVSLPVSSMAAFGTLYLLFDYGPQPITNWLRQPVKDSTTSQCIGMQPYDIAALPLVIRNQSHSTHCCFKWKTRQVGHGSPIANVATPDFRKI